MLNAVTASFHDDGYCSVFALADNSEEPSSYLILQVTNAPSVQDAELGHAGVHLELGGQNLSGYDLLEDLRKDSTGLLLVLKESAAQKAGIDRFVAVNFVGQAVDRKLVDKAFNLFRQRLSS